MAQFRAEDVDNYGSQGNGTFFALKNDLDTATVRILYKSPQDVMGMSVHEVKVDNNKRYVDCLRTYSDPLDMCPLCAARYRTIAKLFIPLYNMDAEEMQIWDRGKKFISRMTELCAEHGSLINIPFEIERHGVPGDVDTKYELFALEPDDVTIEDLPELPKILGGLVIEATAEDMICFLNNGVFPQSTEKEDKPAARNPEKDKPARRTAEPATGAGRGARRPAATEKSEALPESNRRRRSTKNKSEDDAPFK